MMGDFHFMETANSGVHFCARCREACKIVFSLQAGERFLHQVSVERVVIPQGSSPQVWKLRRALLKVVAVLLPDSFLCVELSWNLFQGEDLNGIREFLIDTKNEGFFRKTSGGEFKVSDLPAGMHSCVSAAAGDDGHGFCTNLVNCGCEGFFNAQLRIAMASYAFLSLPTAVIGSVESKKDGESGLHNRGTWGLGWMASIHCSRCGSLSFGLVGQSDGEILAWVATVRPGHLGFFFSHFPFRFSAAGAAAVLCDASKVAELDVDRGELCFLWVVEPMVLDLNGWIDAA